MADIERLDRALAWIGAHPEQHDQGVWLKKVDCGTAGCLAGWVVVQAHPEAKFVQDVYDIGNTYSRIHVLPLDNLGEAPLIEDVARRLLDINSEQADELFDGDNTIEHLKQMRDLLVDDPGVTYYELAEIRGVYEDDEE